MALKGGFVFFDKLPAVAAYAVIDAITISKGGDANFHVSIYPTAPETKAVEQEAFVMGVIEKTMVDVVERGPVIEHIAVAGLNVTTEPFGAAYDELKKHPRFSSMSNA